MSATIKLLSGDGAYRLTPTRERDGVTLATLNADQEPVATFRLNEDEAKLLASFLRSAVTR